MLRICLFGSTSTFVSVRYSSISWRLNFALELILKHFVLEPDGPMASLLLKIEFSDSENLQSGLCCLQLPRLGRWLFIDTYSNSHFTVGSSRQNASDKSSCSVQATRGIVSIITAGTMTILVEPDGETGSNPHLEVPTSFLRIPHDNDSNIDFETKTSRWRMWWSY